MGLTRRATSSAEGKLALAGPFDGVHGWRGLFIFAVPDIEKAKRLNATDPLVGSGERVDRKLSKKAFERLLFVRGRNPPRDTLIDTPRRTSIARTIP